MAPRALPLLDGVQVTDSAAVVVRAVAYLRAPRGATPEQIAPTVGMLLDELGRSLPSTRRDVVLRGVADAISWGLASFDGDSARLVLSGSRAGTDERTAAAVAATDVVLLARWAGAEQARTGALRRRLAVRALSASHSGLAAPVARAGGWARILSTLSARKPASQQAVVTHRAAAVAIEKTAGGREIQDLALDILAECETEAGRGDIGPAELVQRSLLIPMEVENGLEQLAGGRRMAWLNGDVYCLPPSAGEPRT